MAKRDPVVYIEEKDALEVANHLKDWSKDLFIVLATEIATMRPGDRKRLTQLGVVVTAPSVQIRVIKPKKKKG